MHELIEKLNKANTMLLICFILSLLICPYGFSQEKIIKKSDLADVQVFHRGNAEEVDSLDPAKATGVSSINVIVDLYEGLMTADQSGKIILGQAKSYEISKDLKTYTFKLRDKLLWSNGEKLTADDFVAGMRRTVDPRIGSVYTDILKPIKNVEKIINGRLPIEALGVKAINDKTLVIELEKPTPYFLELLVHSTTYPIYQPNLKKYGSEFIKPGKLVSNGAFKLSEWVVNSHLSVIKNPYYRNADKVILDKVVFYPIEQSMELNRYRAGDLDFTSVIPDVQFKWIKDNLSKELYIAPQLATYYYSFNLDRPPFKDNKNLRQALALVIDKKIIAEKVLRSGQIATNYIVPENINNYETKNRGSMNDWSKIDSIQRLTLAKEYYKKAGYSKENPAIIRITYNTSESHKNVAIALAAMFKKSLGVKTELVNQEWKVFLRTRLERKETELFRDGWVGDYNDPSTFLDLFISDNHQNHSGFKNKEYDKLMKSASVERDKSQRAEALAKAEQLLLDEVPVIPLYTYVTRHLIKPNVGGYAANILDITYDRYIYIKKTQNS